MDLLRKIDALSLQGIINRRVRAGKLYLSLWTTLLLTESTPNMGKPTTGEKHIVWK